MLPLTLREQVGIYIFISVSQAAKIEQIILILYYLKKIKGQKMMKFYVKLLRIGHLQQQIVSTCLCQIVFTLQSIFCACVFLTQRRLEGTSRGDFDPFCHVFSPGYTAGHEAILGLYSSLENYSHRGT